MSASISEMFFKANSFLQSAQWEDFQRAIGNEVWRIRGVLVIKHCLPKGFNYLYIPRLNNIPIEQLSLLVKELSKIGASQGSIFLKIDPISPLPDIEFSKNIRPAHSIQPRKTIIVDLTLKEEEIFEKMHSTLQYSIRRAQRNGIVIRSILSSNIESDIGVFLTMLSQTARRSRFRIHPPNHYLNLFRFNSPDFLNELFFAIYKNKPVAAAIANFFYDRQSNIKTASFLHGASSDEGRRLNASHLLHWTMMRTAKKHGCHLYDFWGIDEKRWPGVTKFKMRFGGEVIELPQSLDFVFRPAVYGLYKIVRRFKSLI